MSQGRPTYGEWLGMLHDAQTTEGVTIQGELGRKALSHVPITLGLSNWEETKVGGHTP